MVELLLGTLCKHNSSTGKRVLWNFLHHRFLRRIFLIKTLTWGKFLQCIILIPSGKFFPGNNSLLCILCKAGLLSWNFSGYLLHTLLWILIPIQCPPSIFWFLIISIYNILRFDIEKILQSPRKLTIWGHFIEETLQNYYFHFNQSQGRIAVGHFVQK